MKRKGSLRFLWTAARNFAVAATGVSLAWLAFGFPARTAIGGERQRYNPTLESLDKHPVPEWYKDAKFGIFIHWGVYSVPAWASPTSFPLTAFTEWYWKYQQTPGSPAWTHHLDSYGPDFLYDDFIPHWKAERFDPKSWIDLFKNAGAKYFILVAKHKDGFALWPTATSHRNAFEMGPHRDLVGVLFGAARKRGDIKGGFHYSWESGSTRRPTPIFP